MARVAVSLTQKTAFGAALVGRRDVRELIITQIEATDHDLEILPFNETAEATGASRQLRA